MRFRRLCPLLLIAAVIALAAISPGCRKTHSAPPTLTPVRASQVQWMSTGKGTTYSANIAPYAQVDLAFKSSGYIVSIGQVRGADGRMRNVGEGDWVSKGTVLATVQQDQFEEKLAQANAQLSRAQADYERAKLSFDRASTLYAVGAATKPDYDNANAQLASAKSSVEAARASVTEARIALGYCQLRAPFDAWILKRNVDVGSLVGPATNGFTLADTRQVKAVFGVPDTVLGSIRLGSPETITTEAVARAFRGHVSAISPAADPRSRVYSVEVTIPNPQYRLKPGMIASITIGKSQQGRQVPVVPLSAVIQSPDNTKGFAVFIVASSSGVTQARAQDVSLGQAYGNRIAVLSGVRPGELVVTSGTTMIRSGEEVRVIP